MGAVLRVDRVTKHYGARRVLDDVSFELAAGGMTLLAGRSGSGKSTLFRLLAALDRPTSGSIFIEGVDLATLSDASLAQIRLKRIGLIFQNFNLLPDLTALENVRLPLDLAGVPRAKAAKRAADLLALVDVSSRAEARPNVLSGGEQQRVAVARALTNDPAILLADEPTGNLDRANAENVLDLLEDVNRRLGTAIFLISHDELAAERFSRRLHLEDGRLSETRVGDAGLPRPTLRA